MENLSTLARTLGISRPTLYKYRAAGCPVNSPEAARDWIAKRKASENRGGKRTAPADSKFWELKEALQRADLRKTEAEARLKEFEAEIAQKNLVSMDEARAAIAEVLGPLRVLLDSLPKACAGRANPSDPELAEAAIREAVDGVFRAMDRAREVPANGG